MEESYEDNKDAEDEELIVEDVDASQSNDKSYATEFESDAAAAADLDARTLQLIRTSCLGKMRITPNQNNNDDDGPERPERRRSNRRRASIPARYYGYDLKVDDDVFEDEEEDVEYAVSLLYLFVILCFVIF